MDEETEGDDVEEEVEDGAHAYVAKVLALASEIPRRQKLMMGHQLKRMLISCSFSGFHCKQG